MPVYKLSSSALPKFSALLPYMNNKKVTIVLLPGLNGTDGLFLPLIDKAPDNFDLLVLSYPTHQKLSYDQLVTFVLKKLEGLCGKYVLIGESFSGPLSLFISDKKPDGLIGTILVASFITAPNLKIGRFLPWTIGFTLTKPLYSLRLMLSKSENSSFIKSISVELQKVSPKILADRIQSIFAVNAKVQLENCSVPLMYFQGNKDFVVPKRNLDNMLAIKPDIKVVEFDTQHFLLQSAPIEAWQAISAFVAGLESNK